MTGFYARWAVIVGGIILLAMMTFQQYQRDLSTISLATVLNNLAQRGGDTITQRKKILSELRYDLEYMQDNYRLVQK